MADKYYTQWFVSFNVVRVFILLLVLVFSMRVGAEANGAEANGAEINIVDPTRPDIREKILMEEISVFDYTLSMLVKNRENSYAIINGVMLKENEEIAGAVVKRISGSKVVLDKNGKKIILSLYGVKVFQ